MLDILITTLIREIQNSAHADVAKKAAARFVRSVVRVFVVANSSVSAGVSKRRR